MAKGRFGGETYQPRQLGPEPSSPGPVAPAAPSMPGLPEATTAISGNTEAEPSVQALSRPAVDAPAAVGRHAPATATQSEMAMLRSIRVPFSSRITAAADRQLRALSREGQGTTQTDLLAEALNLLFKKHGRDQVA